MLVKKGKKLNVLVTVSLILVILAGLFSPVSADELSMQELMDKYWEKGVSIQYQSGGPGINELLDLEKEEVQYTVCSDFTYDFYKSHYDITIGHSTRELRTSPYIYYTFDTEDWENSIVNGSWFNIIHDNVEVGDLIDVINKSTGTGHVMMVHTVTEDDVLLIHSTGSKPEGSKSAYDENFIEGSIKKSWMSKYFTAKSYLNDKILEVHLIRPLGISNDFEIKLPAQEESKNTEEQPKEEEIIIPEVVNDGLSHIAIMTDPHVPYAAVDGTEEHTKINEEGKKVHNNTIDGTQAKVFGKALLDAQKRGASAVLVTGDLTYNSKPEQFELYLDTINKYSNVNVIESIGNHDLAVGVTNVSKRANLRDQWEQYIGEKVYYDTWVDDVHVISIGTDSDEPTISGYSSGGSMSKEQLNWLKTLLDEDLKNSTTSIILTHWPVAGTYPADTHSDYYGYYNEGVDEALFDLVASHENTILFSGHTHASYKTGNQLRIFKTENGGTFVHAGIIYTGKPVYVMMDEVPSDNSVKYILSYVNIDSSPLVTFEFEHSIKQEVVEDKSEEEVKQNTEELSEKPVQENPELPQKEKRVIYKSNIDDSIIFEEILVDSLEYSPINGVEAPEVENYQFLGWESNNNVYKLLSGAVIGDNEAKSFLSNQEIKVGDKIDSLMKINETTENGSYSEIITVPDNTVFTAVYEKIELSLSDENIPIKETSNNTTIVENNTTKNTSPTAIDNKPADNTQNKKVQKNNITEKESVKSTETKEAPKTGDNAQLFSYLLLLDVSLIAILLLRKSHSVTNI